MKYNQSLLILIFVVQCFSIIGQSLDGSPAGIMISHSHPKGGWMAAYSLMHMNMNKNLSGTKQISDEAIWNDYIFSPKDMRMDMHMLMGMYGVTGKLSFMFCANYLVNDMDLKLLPGTKLIHHHDGDSITTSMKTNHHHATSGFGDLKLWALYKLHNGTGSSLVFSFGVNIPTGKFDIDAGEHAISSNEHHPYMMQLGTGTFDLMPGITFLKKMKNISWSIQALGTIRPFNNSIGYHYGSELTLNAWTAFPIGKNMSISGRLEGSIASRIEGRDPLIYQVIEPDANPNNYGGQRIYGFTGLNFYFDKHILSDSKLSIEFGLPIHQNLNGPQLAGQYSIIASITKSF